MDLISSVRDMEVPKAPTVEVSKNDLGPIKLNPKPEKATEIDSSFLSSKVNKFMNHVNERPTPRTQARLKSQEIN
jgi:hypothetical protein